MKRLGEAVVTEPDIVAELDAWLARAESGVLPSLVPIVRARDEIVALRKAQWEAITSQCREYVKHVRAEAIEEAALVCERKVLARLHTHVGTCQQCADAIRALKDKPHE